jgi:hypothetical protein
MKTINKILLLAFVLLAFSCEDILEKDISNDTVQILSPLANAQIVSNVVNFQWNKLKGANKYRVQVYSANQSIIKDSLVSNTNLTLPLLQGQYQWRVRGENFAYQSAYSFPVSFSVVQSLDLSTQQVLLSSPVNNLFSKATTLTCSWQAISVANTYELELINVTAGQSIVLQQSNITTTSLLFSAANLSQDAQYQWKVKAVNASSQTPFASRTFSIDRVNPNQSTNSLPANNATQLVNQQVNFSWTVPTDTGIIQSPIASYAIEFSNTNTFTIITQTLNSTTSAVTNTFTSAGDYYWRVKATDGAGNVGATSQPFKITIN